MRPIIGILPIFFTPETAAAFKLSIESLNVSFFASSLPTNLTLPPAHDVVETNEKSFFEVTQATSGTTKTPIFLKPTRPPLPSGLSQATLSEIRTAEEAITSDRSLYMTKPTGYVSEDCPELEEEDSKKRIVVCALAAQEYLDKYGCDNEITDCNCIGKHLIVEYVQLPNSRSYPSLETWIR